MTLFTLQFGRPASVNSWPVLLLSTTLFVWLSGCQSMFVADWGQDSPFPESREIELGARAYQELLQTEPKSQNAHLSQMVERIGHRIAAESERPEYQWEFTLLSGSSQNAFCLPGGKVGVYEGLLPACANEAGLAVVMSHEIAHALQRHGSQRLSELMLADRDEWAMTRLLNHRESKKVEMVKHVYGLGSASGEYLPFTREEESQADSRGLLLMARAGYDPQEAPRVWDRIRQSSASSTPELLSSHPADDSRAVKLNEIVPRALSVYQSAPQRHGMGEQIPMLALAELTLKPATAIAKPAKETTALAVTTPPPAVTTPVPATPPAVVAPTPSASAITIAPAPIVQTAPATAAVTASVVVLPDLGAPTVEGPLTPPTASPIVTASAETTSTAATVVPASAVTTTPASVPATAAPAAEGQPPLFDESDGWKPHQD